MDGKKYWSDTAPEETIENPAESYRQNLKEQSSHVNLRIAFPNDQKVITLSKTHRKLGENSDIENLDTSTVYYKTKTLQINIFLCFPINNIVHNSQYMNHGCSTPMA